MAINQKWGWYIPSWTVINHHEPSLTIINHFQYWPIAINVDAASRHHPGDTWRHAAEVAVTRQALQGGVEATLPGETHLANGEQMGSVIWWNHHDVYEQNHHINDISYDFVCYIIWWFYDGTWWFYDGTWLSRNIHLKWGFKWYCCVHSWYH